MRLFRKIFCIIIAGSFFVTGLLPADLVQIKKIRAQQNKRIKILFDVSRKLAGLAKLPDPKGLTAEQLARLHKYNQWLLQASTKANEMAKNWKGRFTGFDSKYSIPGLGSKGSAVGDVSSMETGPGNEQDQLMAAAIKAIQEMNQSFNAQYLALQQKMRQDNWPFTLASNIMKEKHKNIRDAINEVR